MWELRRRLRLRMEPELVGIVEEMTSKVAAFMSDIHIESDQAVEVFVLDRPAWEPPAM